MTDRTIDECIFAHRPAFPIHPGSDWEFRFGLTKREWMAGLALQGAMANNEVDTEPRILAAGLVAYVDALLLELQARRRPAGTGDERGEGEQD